jgi:hypothetical protein
MFMKNRIIQAITTVTLLTSFALGLAACAHEGPAQRTGRKLDNAADDVKHDLKK